MGIVKATKNADGSDWDLVRCGCDDAGDHWDLTTDHVHADEIPPPLQGARETAEFLAMLINAWHDAGMPMQPVVYPRRDGKAAP